MKTFKIHLVREAYFTVDANTPEEAEKRFEQKWAGLSLGDISRLMGPYAITSIEEVFSQPNTINLD